MKNRQPPRISISLPYGERAARALINEASLQKIPTHVYTQAVQLPQGASLKRRTRSFFEIDKTTSMSTVNSAGYALRKAAGKSKIKTIDLRAMHVSKIGFDRAVASLLDRGGDDADVYVGFPGASLRTFLELGDSRLKVFHAVDAHPVSHNLYLQSFYGKARARAELYPDWLVRRIQRELELADLVLVPSNLVAEQMIVNGVNQTKVRVLPYGVDFGTFKPAETGPAITSRPSVVFVGQISLRKGIPMLLEAVKGLDLDLTMVGNVFDTSITTALPGNVRHISTVPHSVLANIYATADSFIIPSIEDACSLVAMEAAAVGLPVIATRNNGATEILPADTMTIVDPGDVNSIRDALRSVGHLSASKRLTNARAAMSASKILSWSDYAHSALSIMHLVDA